MPPPSRQPARTRTVACPNCGGSIEVRANGLSISAACASCGAVVDISSPDIRLISEAAARTRHPPIAIGTRADLAGSLWEVVGYQSRSDVVEGGSWDEYLLFSPYQGFRFLVHGDADWTLYALLPQDVADPAAGAADGRHYQPTGESTARTDYVLGEFYWRVRVGDTVAVAEFADPPYVLSREQSADEVTWSRGVQLPAATVAAAFKLQAAAVPQTTLDKATARRANTRAVVRISAAALVLLVLLSIIPFGISRDAPVLEQAFQATAADRGHPFSTGDFTVPGAGGNLRIEARSPVRNAWVEFGLSLVNLSSQRTFDSAVTVEEYDGVDSDGSWSEGGQSAGITFGSVPGGSYRLLIDTDALAYTKPSDTDAATVPFTIAIRRHVPSSGFFWLAVVLLVAYPAWRVLADWFAAKPA